MADEDKTERGLVCPACECRHFYTIKVRHVGASVERRRECRHCGKRITTVEKQKK